MRRDEISDIKRQDGVTTGAEIEEAKSRTRKADADAQDAIAAAAEL